MTSRLCVIGAGYVGLVTGVGLASLGHDVTLVEARQDRLASLLAGRVPIFEHGLQEAFDAAVANGRLTVAATPAPGADIVLVCVGTPIGSDGKSDLSQLRSALDGLAATVSEGVPLVIRSTLPPGATGKVVEWSGIPTELIFTNPEFLRQGTALDDFLRPTRVVLGCFPDADPRAKEAVTGLFSGLGAPLLVVDVAAAELIKNGANAFLALKLSFTNELASLSEEYGADVDDVLHGISLDPRIGPAYMRPGLGFGGSCLPKELRALAVAGAARGLALHVTNAASESNAAQQQRFADRVLSVLREEDGRRVALLGLAFKAGTDDVRDSPAMTVARVLLGAGVAVQAYDPAAETNARRELPRLATARGPLEAMVGADLAVVATEWPAFREIDWSEARRHLRQPIVIDGRRLLDRVEMERLGYRYEAVGSPSPAAPGPVLSTRPT
ncbi:MAG TPA: UDP-glucose/GDP-mannose dehydrogenase family protein [Candidatus Limnocylindrales bacterium]|nr:UDP-glucose/GDP-mannose dehydrogenase family protein [Candidatus Limnocylindrales bacterium]